MSQHLSEAPILDPDWSNRDDVLSAIAVMVLGHSATVVDVEVHVTERRPDGGEHVTSLEHVDRKPLA